MSRVSLSYRDWQEHLGEPDWGVLPLSVLFTSVSVPVEPGEPLYLIAYRKLDA